MDSVLVDEKEPRLLQLTFWFQTRYEKGCSVSVQVGSRAPLTHCDYIPLTKIYFYSTACSDDMPIFIVTYNSLKIPIDSDAYIQAGQGRIDGEDITLHFILTVVTSLKSLERTYCSIKEDEDKYSRCEGLSNFIRAESEFLSLFERNEEIQEIKVAEIEEEKYERYISNQILKTQRSKLDCTVMLVLLVLFIIFGYLFQAMERGNLQLERLEKKKARKRVKLQNEKREKNKNKNKKRGSKTY